MLAAEVPMAQRNDGRRERWARRAATLTMTAIALAIVAAVGVALAGPTHRLGLLAPRWALGLFGLAALLGLAAAVLGAVGMGLALAAGASRSVAGSAVAMLIALAAAAPLLVMIRAATAVPVIHDITTDTENPPSWVALRSTRAASENGAAYGGAAVAAQQKRAYPEVTPLTLTLPPDRAFARVEAAARSLGWRIVASAPAEGRLEASDTTRWFGFTDDIVVRVRATAQGSRIDVRSASRVGRSDLGVNARRIRALLNAVAKPA
jgi:uncharacterized protein (DUF1499 family)